VKEEFGNDKSHSESYLNRKLDVKTALNTKN